LPFAISLILLLKGAVTCSNIPIVDYIVREKPTKVSAAGQLKSSAIALTLALLLRNLDTKHNIFFFAHSSAWRNIFLFFIKRVITSANKDLSASTF
jgi:hypothetical protein